LIEDTGQASRLVACGLRPKLRPIEDPEYLDLVSRYRQQDSFARSVRAMANGMGLDVFDVTEAAGIVLGASEADEEGALAALPEGWGTTLTGEPMPDVAAAVRRSRAMH
jgi:hypothetical protein